MQGTLAIFIQGSDGAIICFDLSDASSLKSVHEWAKYVRLHCPEHLSIVLVGTKMDLPAQVTPEDIQ
jgi:GTPase SAR1 family protein